VHQIRWIGNLPFSSPGQQFVREMNPDGLLHLLIAAAE
jgi:hypothetical protein